MLGNVQKYPLGYNKYNGQAFQPYSAFGEEGYHYGFLMTKAYVKNIFMEMEETSRGEYIQKSLYFLNTGLKHGEREKNRGFGRRKTF